MSDNLSKLALLLQQIGLSQNSILTWLAIGLGAFIGIIELASAKFHINLKRKIFMILILIMGFSFFMIIGHMKDIYQYKKQV